MLEFLANHAIGIALSTLPVLSGFIVWLLKQAISWLKSKTNNSELASFLGVVSTMAEALVKEQEQAMKAIMKEVTSPHSEGGREITLTEKAKIKEVVFEQLKLTVKKQAGRVGKIMNLPEDVIDRILKSKIEQAIFDMNKNN